MSETPAAATGQATPQRMAGPDYLRGVMILLMIAFHLVYIEELYPSVRSVVYTFHMPVFLIISGYMMNVDRPWPRIGRTLLWFAVPYVVIETAYIVMASVLPIREHIGHLTLPVGLHHLLVAPLGPYWYLETLIVCGLTYAVAFHCLGHRLSVLSRLVLMGIVFWLYGLTGCTGLSLAYTPWFLAGVVVRRSGLSFDAVFRPSWMSAVAFALLAAGVPHLGFTTTGMLVVYTVVSALLAAWPHLGGRCRSALLYLGRNSLPLFLFSPVFTFACKPLVAPLAFDPTGMLYLAASLAICVGGSLAAAWSLDRLGLSRWFVGRVRMLT